MQLIYKEAYWLITCLTNITNEACNEKMGAISEFIQKQFQKSSVDQLNKQFVPNENDRNIIISIAQSSQVSSEWLPIIPDFEFEENGKKFNMSGCIILRLKIDESKLKASGNSRNEIRSNQLQQLIFMVWNKLIDTMKDCFLFDQSTIPYFAVVCSGYSDPALKIEWTKESIVKYAEELGQWAEIYSGQYPDYRNEVYLRRIEEDLSNRESEVHIINKNSAMFYMDPENYTLFFKKDSETPNSTGYMYETVIKTAARIRAILHSMLLINQSIDIDTKNLSQKN